MWWHEDKKLAAFVLFWSLFAASLILCYTAPVAAGLLLTALVIVLYAAWRKWRPAAFKRWVKRRIYGPILAHLMRRYGETPDACRQGMHAGRNRCGSGGQTFQPLTKTWADVFLEWPGDSSVRQMSQQQLNKQARAVTEELFFGYFGPLESWCERNFAGEFYLWSDDIDLYLLIMEANDRTLWQLTWGNALPHAQDF
jgi:hypothetical protein